MIQFSLPSNNHRFLKTHAYYIPRDFLPGVFKELPKYVKWAVPPFDSRLPKYREASECSEDHQYASDVSEIDS